MNKFETLYKQTLNEEYENEEVFEKYLDKINFRNEDLHKLQDIIEILGYRLEPTVFYILIAIISIVILLTLYKLMK